MTGFKIFCINGREAKKEKIKSREHKRGCQEGWNVENNCKFHSERHVRIYLYYFLRKVSTGKQK